MANPIEIAAFVPGLLDIVQAQNRGKGLQELKAETQPCLELLRLVGLSRRRFITNNTATFNAGEFTLQGPEVPAGRIWRIVAVEWNIGDVTVPAASNYLRPAIRLDSVEAGQISVTAFDAIVPSTGQGNRFVFTPPDLWVPAGTGIFFRAYASGAFANASATYNVYVEEFVA